MPLTSQQLKARTDLARKQTSKGLTPTQFQTGTTVTKTGFAEKIGDDAMANQQRIFKKRQACEAKGGTFNTTTEQCSMGITEELAVTPTGTLEERIKAGTSFRGEKPTKEQEALNLIARGDVEQVATGDVSTFSEETLATLAGAKKLEEEAKKTGLEKKLEAAKKAAEFKAKQLALKSQAVGTTAGEPAQNIAIQLAKQGVLTERAKILEEDFAINQQEIADKQIEIQEALSSGRVDLVKQARASMLDLRKQELNLKTQATSDVIETLGDTLLGKSEDELEQIALDQNVDLGLLKLQQEKLQLKDKTAEAKTQLATQKQSQSFVKGLNNDQLGALTSEQASALNESAGLPAGTVESWALRAQEIIKLDKDQQVIENAKLQANINKTNAESLQKQTETQEILQQINPLSFINNIPSTLSSGDMANAVGGGVQVKQSIPGTDTSKLGNGKIILGSDWIWGLDIDGELGQEIQLPGYLDGGTIVESGTQSGFGNFVKIRDDLGREWQFSHLQNVPEIGKGERVDAGDLIGKIGNTGTVFPKPSKNNPGAGSHIDITVRQNGKEIPADQVEKLLNIGSNKNRPLDKEQFAQYDKITKNFSGNAEVKAFEKSVTEGRNLISSLNTPGGAGDMAAVFQFMKSLDPGSVVRESEFELAATTSGVLDWRNIFSVAIKGDKLTGTQRIQFKKLAKQYIRNRAKVYQDKYSDMENITQRQRIPLSTLPTNLSVDLLNEIGEKDLTGLSNDDFLLQVNFNKSKNLDNLGFFGTGTGAGTTLNKQG